MFAARHDGGEQFEFLRGHLRKTIKPETGQQEGSGVGSWELGVGFECLRCEIEQTVGVFQIVFVKPVEIRAEQQGEVRQLGAEHGWQSLAAGEGGEDFWRETGALKFAQQQTELLREAGQARGGAEQFQLRLLLREQGAQHHHAALVIEPLRRRGGKFFKDETGEALEGKNLQTGVAGRAVAGEQLAFELEGGLLGREQDERRAGGIGAQRGADFLQAAEGLAAAGGAEKEARLHATVFAQRAEAAKKFIGI